MLNFLFSLGNNSFVMNSSTYSIFGLFCDTPGLYAENAIDVARREMAWEVDYLREAKNSQQFR